MTSASRTAPLPPWLASQQSALLRQRGHAWLLQGPAGLGQWELGLALVRAWLCESAGAATEGACGQCPSCHAIAVHAHADLLVLMPEVRLLALGWPLPEKAQAEIDDKKRKPSKEIRVDALRQAVEFCQRTSARGRGKAVLVYPAEDMNAIAANTLLKTLEEPPPYVKFLLATTDPQKLPITILSRCLQFHLKSLDQTQIARQLEWVLDQEGQPFEPRALLALAKAADGSMRDALSLTDQALAHGNGSVRLESVLAMLGTLDHHHLHQLLEAVLRQDAPATMAKITEIATLGPDFDQLHAELEALLHRVAMAQLLPASVQEQGADADALLQLAGAMSPEEVQLCYQIVLGGRKDLPWAPDGRTALEMTCLRMLAFSPRREAVHPANLSALPVSMGALPGAGREAVSALPGKPSGAEPAPHQAATAASMAAPSCGRSAMCCIPSWPSWIFWPMVINWPGFSGRPASWFGAESKHPRA